MSGTVRDQCIYASLCAFAPEPLFILSVDAYNRAPTKTKAIAIYTTFIAAGASQINCDQLISGSVGETLEAIIEQYIAQAAQAREMNFFRRVFTSSSRQAQRNIFDRMMNGLLTMQDSPMSDALNKSVDDAPSLGKKPAKKIKTALLQAGFSSVELGLTLIE
ncbi:MAG: hypothetical protein VYC39_12910 [Myxococcota bacterium]|nr:hypothetical protein [Myxococcota bacterium]